MAEATGKVSGEVIRDDKARAGEAIDFRGTFGLLLCGAGLMSAVVGLIDVDISLEAVGIMLGFVGYAVGARVAGTVTMVVSTALLILVLVIGTGELPLV